MPQEASRAGILVFYGIFTAFAAVVAFGMAGKLETQIEGLILVGIGAICIAFSRQLAVAQQALSEKPFIPDHWRNVRPLTFVLWGSGICVLGIIDLVGL